MDTKTLRHSALDLWLKGVRLPLTAVEAVAVRGSDTSAWRPAIAFEKVEATVKDAVGRITRDEELVGLARLQRAEVAKREEALVKRDVATSLREESRRAALAERAEIEERRDAAEERAQAREDRLEEERAAAARQAEAKASKKKAAAKKAAESRKEATARKATKVKAEQLREEADSLRVKEQAVEARGDVLELDAAVRAKKAARRAG